MKKTWEFLATSYSVNSHAIIPKIPGRIKLVKNLAAYLYKNVSYSYMYQYPSGSKWYICMKIVEIITFKLKIPEKVPSRRSPKMVYWGSLLCSYTFKFSWMHSLNFRSKSA